MSVQVPVARDVIAWALERASDEEAVAAAFPRLEAWLTGEAKPTLRQLERFAARTGTPFGYLLMDSPPALTLPVRTSAKVSRGSRSAAQSPDLLAVVHQSIRRQEWYRNYATDNALPQVGIVGSARSEDGDRDGGRHERATHLRCRQPPRRLE